MPRSTADRIDRNRPWSTVPGDLSRWRRSPCGPTVATTTMAIATAHERPLPRWQRSLLPAVLGADHADRGQPGGVHLPRSLRDWVVDVIMFGFALAIGAAGAWQDAKHAPTAGGSPSTCVVGLAVVRRALGPARPSVRGRARRRSACSAFSGMAGRRRGLRRCSRSRSTACRGGRAGGGVVVRVERGSTPRCTPARGGYHFGDLLGRDRRHDRRGRVGAVRARAPRAGAVAARAQPPAAGRAGAARRRRRAGPSATGSRGRCTTCSRTGSRC